jgi:hypothetical protein
MTNFRLHNEQPVNGLGKIAWASIFHLMSPHPCLNVSMSPCLYVAMSLCRYFSMSCLHVSTSPCFRFRKQKTELTEKATFVCFLQMDKGNGKLSLVCCKRKQKIDVCFPWSVNDNSNRRVLFQQTCLSMHTT